MGNAVVHFEIQSGDGDAAAKFYSELFGWHIQSMPEMSYNLVDTHAGAGVNGGIGGNAEGDPFVTVYVDTADPQATLDKAESLGAKTILPVSEIPGIVTLAMFTDPQGNKIGLVKNAADQDAPGVSPGSNPPVEWFEVLGPDAKALRDFYSKVFGWATTGGSAEGIEYYQLDPQGKGIGGGIGGSPTGEPMTTVYAKVDDLQKYLDRAEQLGAKTIVQPMDVGDNVSIAQFADPQGNVFGLYKDR